MLSSNGAHELLRGCREGSLEGTLNLIPLYIPYIYKQKTK